MQTAAIVILVLWFIFSVVSFLNRPGLCGWFSSLIESVVSGFIFAAGTIALITITLLLVLTALGLI